MNDLTGFQRDLLRSVAVLGPAKGLKLRDHLEDEEGYQKVHHGRLYPNLDTLVEMGLISKEKQDRRTNSYELTRRGQRDLREHGRKWTEFVDDAGAEA